jgi:hypothetical protein
MNTTTKEDTMDNTDPDYHIHYADEAPVVIHVTTFELGYTGARTVYACAGCQAETEAFAASRPEYVSHQVSHRTVTT